MYWAVKKLTDWPPEVRGRSSVICVVTEVTTPRSRLAGPHGATFDRLGSVPQGWVKVGGVAGRVPIV